MSSTLIGLLTGLLMLTQSPLQLAHAAGPTTVETNAVVFSNAPSWLKASRIDHVVDGIQNVLEWDIRRIQAYYYVNAAEFEKVHGFGPLVLAVSRKEDSTVHVGPKVTATNFDGVFGHELVHVILFQKYNGAIPKWLEEGLANYAAKKGPVDYAALARKGSLPDLHSLSHPFAGANPLASSSQTAALDHYQLSRAAIEMIASKCSLSELLQLSVGKNLENFLGTFCGIEDVNASFKAWVKRKAKSKT